MLLAKLTRSIAIYFDDMKEVSRGHSTSPVDGRTESLMQGADIMFSSGMEG